MSKTRKSKPHKRYDNLIKYICQKAGIGILEMLFQTNPQAIKELPVEHRFWIVRQHDYLWQVANVIYHVEFQFQNDSKMPYRMGHYQLLLAEKYPHCLIESIVVYMGQPPCNMPNELKMKNMHISYNLIDIAEDIDAQQFLDAPAIEIQLMAVLAKQESEDAAKETVKQLVQRLKRIKNKRQLLKLFYHLQTFAQLRKLATYLETQAMKEELLLPFELEITPLMQKYIDMAEEAKQIMLQERQAKEQERQAKEQERQAKEEAKQIMLQERQAKEQERQAKEEAKQIMLQERQAKERLAAKLKELGIDPETVV